MGGRGSGKKSTVDEQSIVAARMTGETLEAIGAIHGITKERVRQICRKHGAGRQNARHNHATIKLPASTHKRIRELTYARNIFQRNADHGTPLLPEYGPEWWREAVKDCDSKIAELLLPS